MKKRFSTLTVVIIGFLMMATGVYAGEAFDRWMGEEHTQNTINNLNDINTGITVLQQDLENTEQDLLAKQAELDTANADLKTEKDKTASLEEKLDNSLEGVTLEELKILVSNTNKESGLRKKYDNLKDGINQYLVAKDVPVTERLNDHNDKEAEDNQLKEALKDVKQLEEKSGEVLESLNPPVETTGDNN